MPEFRTSKQRRQKSRTENQNNKHASKHAGHQPQTFETAMLAYQTGYAETSESKTIDINGNVHLDSLPTHEQETNIARSQVLSSKSTKPPNQEDSIACSIQPRSRRGSDCSMMSIRSSSLADIRDIQDNPGNEESCSSAKANSPGFSKTSSDQPVDTTPHEPPVNLSTAGRHSSVPGISQRRPWFRSASGQRKPARANSDGKTGHSDFSKRQGDHVNLKTGANNKRYSVPGTHSFPAAPPFNIPLSHMFHPNPFPYGPQMPQVNLTEQQRLQIWSHVGGDRHNLFPLQQHAYGTNQAGRQFQDKNYGNAFKQKYPRNAGQDQPEKTNQFQNRFKSKKHTGVEGTGINMPPCKDITHSEKDVQQMKPNIATYLPELRSMETSESLHNNDDAGISLSQAEKHALSSSKGEPTGNQIINSESKDKNSQRERSTVAGMEHKFQKALQLTSTNTDNEASKASQIVQRQTRTGRFTSRENPNSRRTNPTFPTYVNGMPGCASACVPGKAHTWSQTESFNGQRKHNRPSYSHQDQTKAGSNRPCRSDKFVPGKRTSVSNKYSALPPMPLKFDPTVHPLQAFQNSQVREYNHHWLRQCAEKLFSTCISAPGNIPQKASVSEGCSNNIAGFNKEVSNRGKENQMPNVTASTNTAKETVRPNTSYTRNCYSMPITDSLTTVNPSHFKDTMLVSNGAHTDSGALTLTINEEIEEEMMRAQCMSIPVKHNSERCASLQSQLNPKADEFSPPLSDSNGNLFTMTKQNGVCYFKRDLGNSIAIHQESNTSYEHEVAEILISTSDNILKNYSNDNYHFIAKESRNKFFPAHEQQEYHGSEYPFYSGYCTTSTDVSRFSASHVYNTLPTPYISAHTPESALSANEMHPSDNYYAPRPYYNETCTQYFTPAHSQANLPVLPSPEIQIHPQHPYTNQGYTLCSFMPIYVTPSPAATPVIQYSGTEYSPALMQAPVGPGVPFTVSAPSHMAAQTQPSLFSGSEAVPAQNYSFQAPVFSMQAYHEATQNNSPVNPHTPAHSDLKRDHLTVGMTQNSPHYTNDRETKWEENIHSETTHSQNADSKGFAETCHVQLNSAEPVTSSIHRSNNKADNHENPSENKSSVISESDVHVANDIRKTPEFEECKVLLERLRNREFTLDKCRQSVPSEPETHTRYIEKWLEVAVEIIKESANKLTIEEMALIMLVPSLRKKVGIDKS